MYLFMLQVVIYWDYPFAFPALDENKQKISLCDSYPCLPKEQKRNDISLF